ncbi:MAG: hypothetical protein R2879_22190 [Saprospiraceae bacterium]
MKYSILLIAISILFAACTGDQKSEEKKDPNAGKMIDFSGTDAKKETQPKELEVLDLGTVRFEMGEEEVELDEFVMEQYSVMAWYLPQNGNPGIVSVALAGEDPESMVSVTVTGKDVTGKKLSGTYPMDGVSPTNIQIALSWGPQKENNFSFNKGNGIITLIDQEGNLKLSATGSGIYTNTKDHTKMKQNVPASFEIDVEMPDVVVDNEYVKSRKG